MKFSPLMMAVVYLLMGIFFIYIALLSADETIWNVTTMILALFATLNIGVSIRLVYIHIQLKKNKKE